jgi:hypothetical protein
MQASVTMWVIFVFQAKVGKGWRAGAQARDFIGKC